MDTKLKLTVNGKPSEVMTDPDRPLLDLLREDLHLTGTKYGCGEGRCGACTVIIDGKRTFSCITPAAKAQGKAVQTIEGLTAGGGADGEGGAAKLHPVQEAFLAEGAFQCGYCTPGMVMATVALLAEKPRPTDAEITSWMNTNLCRCCGYPSIIDAVRRAAGRAKEGGGRDADR